MFLKGNVLTLITGLALFNVVLCTCSPRSQEIGKEKFQEVVHPPQVLCTLNVHLSSYTNPHVKLQISSKTWMKEGTCWQRYSTQVWSFQPASHAVNAASGIQVVMCKQVSFHFWLPSPRLLLPKSEL